METLVTSANLWFASAALLLFLIAVAVGSITVIRSELAEADHRRKTALMPAFDQLQAAQAALVEKRKERDELLEEVKVLRQEQAELERHRLDAQHWQSLAEQAKRDYDSRQSLIDEVERLRTDYENAAKDLAERNEQLTELTRKRSELSTEIEAAQQQLKELEEQRQTAQDLTDQLEKLRAERDKLLAELNDIRDQRDERLRAAFEVGELARRKSELEGSLADLPNTVKELSSQRDQLLQELEGLKRDADRLREARNEVDRLQERKMEVRTSIDVLEREKTRLEEAVGLMGGGKGSKGDDDTQDNKITDLVQYPICLFGHGEKLLMPRPDSEKDETKFLSRVAEHLRELGFDFPERVLYRFHTSLKTAFISPLTVLAGISGTGKSQLPQRYAEAMGMHFLKVAVQPRWDSPQDLLGFYNYLEKSYKATELARALVRMDSKFPLRDGEVHTDDRMLLVLLDEMNLARVEYYFSEFLSRLEGRPEADAITDEQRLPGLIDFDIPRKSGDLLSVYPGHNVLFVGTMNEDESTQALSDKVLDRANTLRFRKPEDLRSETLNERKQPLRTHLPFETWKSWRRGVETLPSNFRKQTRSYVLELNELLSEIGRPFGHRVSQAIHAYVANYPNLTTTAHVQRALADTLALRILPKLRGIELEDRTPQVLRQISKLAQEKLGEEALAKSIDDGLSNTDAFHWTG